MIPTPKEIGSEAPAIAELKAQFSPAGQRKRRLRRAALGMVWRVGLLFSDSAKRLMDATLAALGLVATSPCFLAAGIFAWINGREIFHRERKIGRWAVPFSQLEFSESGNFGMVLRRFHLRRLPLLLNVLRGEMSLVGPRALSPDELNLREHSARKRSGVRPGLLSLWWLRKRANIDFGSELDVDLEYIDRRSFGSDLGIAARALPAICYGSSAAVAPNRVDVLGISVDNLTMDEALQYILDAAASEQPRRLCFVNADCINKSRNDPTYAGCLRSADLVLADGIGIRLAGKILRRQIRQNVNGTDLFPRLCARLRGSTAGLYLLGGRPGVAKSVAEWVRNNYPGVTVRGYRDGYFSPSEEAAVLQEIRNSGADILLVAFGAPRQDLWIAEHMAELETPVAFGVGGLFDFYSARLPRAPQWARELSLEWIYRLIQEPQRMWRRYLLGNALFIFRVMVSAFFRPFFVGPEGN